MVLVIKKTGLEEYAPGGSAWIKAMIVGGPGVGKTRFASYFPKPFFVNCERGMAAVADREVPYVDARTSTDMLDMLKMMRLEAGMPRGQRQYETVVIDTLDAHQRNLKDEWVRRNHATEFSGWEAWGWLNTQMSTLMVRLLNLEANVIINVHYKDKVTKDSDTGRETHELMLQLQGETADTAMNDPDLIGWLEADWDSAGGKRVRRRTLTFQPTPRLPFLKDRLNVVPESVPVRFEPADYTRLFEAVHARIANLKPSENLGEVPSAEPERAPLVMPPGLTGTGVLPGAATADATGGQAKIGLSSLDKPTLLKRCRDEGVTRTADGQPIRGNTLKSELVATLEAFYAAQAPADTKPATRTPEPAAAPAPEPAGRAAAAPAGARVTVDDTTYSTATGEEVKEEKSDTSAGITTPSTPEPADPQQEARELMERSLGAQVIEEVGGPHVPPAPEESPAKVAEQVAPKPAVANVGVCADCEKDLAGEKPDYIKLSWIKHRQKLCESCYTARKRPA